MRALFRGLPEEIKLIKPFVKLYELELMDTEPIDHAESQCYAASHEAAHVLINKYSNISSISTTALDPHEFFQKLIAELAVGYDKQLTKFASSMPATFPYTLLAPNLVELDLRFWASLDIIFPTISPRSLRKISIALDKHPFSWDMFHVGNVSEAIVFDNLVDLSISGMARDLDDGNAVIAHGLDLVFPKLERLSLSNISITRKDAQAMMAHGLRRLRCKGSIITASQLCKHPLGNLDNLYLSWVEEPYPEEADDFILLANEIFNKTEGIGHVQLEIRYANFAGSMDGVDWPYLTHLSLSFTMPFKALFDILPNVPNLVQLDMIIGSYDEHVLDETTELLINIKKHYSTPSSSKIKTLRLADERAVSRQESFFQPQFRKALENLKWYWPQLKDIVTLG
ncbi:hypothetical protein GGH96_002099 [Coemansia sp. RSA 1972]|nr:hypothetical protein GGH96_002099 [Coemansia sp. RSA 1972]